MIRGRTPGVCVPALLGGLEQLDGRTEALLGGHHQHQGRLSVADRPVHCPDRGDTRLRPRHAHAHDLTREAARDLVYQHSAEALDCVRVDDRDVNRVLVEAGQAGCLQGGDAVEAGDSFPDLPDRPPTTLPLRERPRVDRDGLVSVNGPSLGAQFGPDVCVCDTGAAQLRPRHHTVVQRGQFVGDATSLRAVHVGRLASSVAPWNRCGLPGGRADSAV